MEQLTNKQKIILFILGGIAILVILAYVFTKDASIDYSDFENIYEENNNIENKTNETTLIIHVVGEIKMPGVVELNAGDRVIDAIEKAGGETEYADLSKINLAYKVEDGQKIYIPSVNDDEMDEEMYITKNSGQTDIDETNGGEGNIININTATQTELEQLPGIGPSTSLKIIQYRDENGKFGDIEEIKNVPGIGDAKYESIKESICVN